MRSLTHLPPTSSILHTTSRKTKHLINYKFRAYEGGDSCQHTTNSVPCTGSSATSLLQSTPSRYTVTPASAASSISVSASVQKRTRCSGCGTLCQAGTLRHRGLRILAPMPGLVAWANWWANWSQLSFRWSSTWAAANPKKK
jgi:hypothetical protein